MPSPITNGTTAIMDADASSFKDSKDAVDELPATVDTVLAKLVVRKLDWRLMPIMFITYNFDSNFENSNELILSMFNDIFDIIKKDVKKYNGYKFYCHNLGRFDSIFIIRALVNGGYDIKGK